MKSFWIEIPVLPRPFKRRVIGITFTWWGRCVPRADQSPGPQPFLIRADEPRKPRRPRTPAP